MSDKAGLYSLTGLQQTIPLTAGALANQNGYGKVIYRIVGQISTFDISSAVNSTVLVKQFVSVQDTFNLNTSGGTIELSSGATLGETVHATISGGGNYIVDSGGLNHLPGEDTVAFSGTGGTLTIGSPGQYGSTAETATISGLTTPMATVKINNRSLKFAAVTGYSVTGTAGGGDTVTVIASSGNFSFKTINADLATGNFTPGSGQLTFTRDKSGGTVVGVICFVRGTRLATPDGETAVESLAVGDLVATREDGETVFRPVTWVGHRAVDVRRMRGTVDAHPVRIRAGAFAANVPHRDLLVTPDHCVFVDGRLIPARMLVNGGSIVADTSISKYEFFHVELERHAILVAEGLETESYLDTGNRANFVNVAVPNAVPSFAVDAAHATWATRAAAPLAVDRATVEPIWQRLVERSRLLGLGADAGVALGTDPALCVVTGSGETIYPKTRDGRVYSFVVPSDATSLRLVSNASRPSEVVGPFVDDRRALGVLVGVIGLDTGFGRTATIAAEFADAPRGWHAPEASYRWTDGDAVLPLNLAASTGPTVTLDVEVIHAGPYPTKRPLARAA